MSILVKGIDVPKNCDECPIQHKHWGYEVKLCPYSTVDNGTDLYQPIDYRMEDCPIYEVPTPHGRLIDADELREKMIKEADTYIPYVQERERRGYHNCELLVDDAPTVIEREEDV